eukprot:TRINITY_DN881_c0_g1_i8.p1 TRINITY_DN881_c0_g1~~TRINITY_DN881_c0_g1_i8.p1  ORF type:complete len:666 (-),score=107.02 TRINITY_DN881_c0_g1_i8:289-2286(-)
MLMKFVAAYLVFALSSCAVSGTILQEMPAENILSTILPNTTVPFSDIISNPLVQALLNSSPNQIANLILYSGMGMGELGDYFACKNTSDSYYVGAYFGYYFFAAQVGLCLPRHVDMKLLNSQVKFIARLVNGTGGMYLQEHEVQFADIRVTNEKNSKRGVGYYMTWSALGLLILLAIAASIVEYAGGINKNAAERGVMEKLTRCFSFIGNFRSFMSTKNKTDDNLDIFNGIRVFSMVWIIYAHTYDFGAQGPIKNLPEYSREIKLSYPMTIVINGTLSVDVFFFMSGFFAALSFSKIYQNPKNRSFKTVILSYIFRYLRLTPLLVVCTLYRLFIERGTKDYPFHIKLQYDGERCDKTWFLPLLYASNFFSSFADMCIDWTWYIMVDMQMFLISPIVMLVFSLSLNIGFLVLGACFLLSTGIQIFGIFYYKMNYYNKNYSDIYNIMAPYRLLPYLMGIAYCYLYKEHRKTDDFYMPLRRIRDFFYKREWLKYVLYVVCLPVMYQMVFIRNYFDNNQKDVTDGVFCAHEILNRVIFIFFMMLLFYPTLLGKDQFLKKFLGHPLFCIIGRLTYGAYLFHPFYYINDHWFALNGYHFTQIMYIGNAIGTIAVAFFLSFVMTLLLESPVSLLVRTFLEGARSGAPPPKPLPIEEEETINKTVNDKELKAI